jgi:6-phospho-beta-glucosidase
MVNFTNPAGLVTEALSRYVPDVPAAGVCNVAITTKMEIVENLQKQRDLKIDPAQVELNTLGLNHLSWHRGLLADGADIWPQVMEDFVEALKRESDPVWDIATIKALGMIPNYYLQYYYYTERKLKEQSDWPPSRAEQVMEIEADLLRQYAEPHLVELPKDLMQRGGAYYSTLATQVLNAHYNDLNETHVINVAHKGAVSGWPADWVLELPCRINANGVHPIPTQPLSPPCFGLLAQVKAYEILTVEAAVHGDRRAAHQALLAHPLGPSADRIDVVLRDLLESNRDYLPRFFA